ncbi:hypothetical protein TWF718_006967 [Orbilia javanica]|uniref:Zn(2)-C6 fungal-type domain-containing protein n=1 Tax=Orbilia javanica TaxID=47235 RepID=A0AAN8RDH7_9PEZI
MNTNRHSYPPGYGSLPSSTSQLAIQFPPRKTPYWPPGGRTDNANTDLGGQGPSTARKRVNVACARCRKRKIRCSGDPGDDMGCHNCKVAGLAQGQCLFLRVQCQQVPLEMNENSQLGPYDRIGQQMYGGGLSHYTCLSAPPVASSSATGFEGQVHLQRAENPYISAPSLHPRRSMPNIVVKRSSQHGHIIPQPAEESGLALLARNAEAVSSLPTAVTYALATGTGMETLAAVANPTFTRWAPHPMMDGLRAVTDGSPIDLRNNPIEVEATKGYPVQTSLPSNIYFDTNPAPQIASGMGLIPTSNVRTNGVPNGYDYSHFANIAGSVNNCNVTLALQGTSNGKGDQPTQSLLNERCETSTAINIDIPYDLGFVGHAEGAARFSRADAQVLSSPVNTYSVSGSSSGGSYNAHIGLGAMSLSKSTPEAKQSQGSFGKTPSVPSIMTKTARGTNSPHTIERHDLMSPLSLLVPRPNPSQKTITRVPTNRPNSAGCISSVGSPKYAHD